MCVFLLRFDITAADLMASSSLAPIRRKRMSCRPALASKYHFPFFLTSGTGNGHSSSPTMMVARFGFEGSVAMEFLERASVAKATALFLSCTVIAAGDKVFAVGPKDRHQLGYVIGTQPR